MAKVTYTCFAVPPDGILVDRVYETGKDDKGDYYINGDEKVYADSDYINMIFSALPESKEKK